MKALILTYDKFQDHEVIYPYYRLKEYGFDVDISAENFGYIFGINGTKLIATVKTNNLIDIHDYDFLCIPGGVKALEKLRQEKNVIEFVKEWNQCGKIIASICHGAQILISAGACFERNISGYYSIKDDIINAGGTYIDAPVVVDKNIISCPHYDYMGDWMRVALKVYEDWKLNNDGF